MLSNPQKALLKTAQRQIGLADEEYRDLLALVSGMPDCRSSKDDRLTDEHLDKLMSFLEAIYWRMVDVGTMQHTFKPNAAFRQRVFWAARNKRGNTSRDRYTETNIQDKITDLEATLAQFGCQPSYFASIRAKIGQSGRAYAAALARTLKAKQNKAATFTPQP